MSGLDDVREYVVKPALARLGMWSAAAEQLVVGTGLVESQYQHLDQTTPGAGPAYGPWQMERLTHDDIWVNYLPGQPSALRDELLSIAGLRGQPVRSRDIPAITTLHWNLMYGAAMCRVFYRRVRAPLPDVDDVLAMAAYWKQWYNTPAGKGTIAKAIPYFRQVCQP